jgi:PLP dependent protein
MNSTDTDRATRGLAAVQARIAAAERATGRPVGSVRLIAVSKTFETDAIRPVIEAGQRAFGENRVQEARGKWPALRAASPGIELHLIGPLQSNKVKDAVALFDAIHTVDRDRIAEALAAEIVRQGRSLRLLVQVNTGAEPQKAGVLPGETDAFVGRCRDVHGLAIDGLMCIPPLDEAPAPHFALLAKIARRLGLASLSMGMSADFETAIAFGATDVRVGSAIFGERSPTE